MTVLFVSIGTMVVLLSIGTVVLVSIGIVVLSIAKVVLSIGTVVLVSIATVEFTVVLVSWACVTTKTQTNAIQQYRVKRIVIIF